MAGTFSRANAPSTTRFHDLTTLTPAELERWRRAQFGFVRKLAALAFGKRVVLKTPSHTARVDALMELFKDTDGVRFIHISRKPESVFRSNLGLFDALNPMYELQPPDPAADLDRHIANEYRATEERYLEARGRIPAGHLAEVRLQDLQADPVGELKRVYAELGLPYTPEFEARVLNYLDATSDFKPNAHAPLAPERVAKVADTLAPLGPVFGHDQPPLAKVIPPKPWFLAPGTRTRLLLHAALTAPAVAGGFVALTAWLESLVNAPWDPLFGLPAGILTGHATRAVARRGGVWLGVWAAAVTLGASASAGALAGLTSPVVSSHTLFWIALGAVTAFRLAAVRWR